MNVVLDIDETFVQFVGPRDWAELPEEQKIKYETTPPTEHGLFVLRPHFDEFFDFLFKNAATVNLWTWSEKEYAESVAALIQDHNPKWKVTNIWCDTDVDASIEEYGNNKDLNYIWYTKKMFQPCDTILIDDLPENTQNGSNIKNGIQVRPFHPLGQKLKKGERSPGKIRTGRYEDMSKDDTLLRVMEVLKSVLTNPDFCSEGDLPFPFKGSTKVLGGRRKTIRRNKKKLFTRRRK